MNSKESGRRRFLKNSAALAGLAVGAIQPADGQSGGSEKLEERPRDIHNYGERSRFENSFRTGAAGRLQAMLFAIYPITFAPLGLAYLARYAFGSQAALYVVLGLDAIAGLVFYRISLDSAVRAADRTKESLLAALSVGDGPIAN